MKGIGIGMIAGKLGGNGYKPTLHFWDRLYVTDGLNAVKGGVIWGAAVSGSDTLLDKVGVYDFVNKSIEKIETRYNYIRKEIEATYVK